ncbi:MAG TPA: 5-dehydro-2-deoxygluconokinase [Gemmatimonadales bacterium]|nr:5-dehydro-2-deoxygluconokinase [Gemmatimonadales bacterium]
MTAPAFDLLTMGRVSVDLYPEQSGVPLADVRTFAKSLGGSPTNVAVAAARLGRSSAVITRVGADGFGEYVRQALRGFGVDDRFVGTDPELRTPVVFCELHPPDHFPLLFYRQPTAPDINLRLDQLDLEAVQRAKIFWTTGTGLSAEPSRTATLGALEARGRRGITIHDLDFRRSLWPAPDSAGAYQRCALKLATVAIGNLEEVAVAVGEAAPEMVARRLLNLGPELAIVKLGERGVVVGWSGGVERVDAVPVEVVNGLGAGDAFGGAVCHGLLAGWDPVRTVRFAAAAGAYVAARLACADAMPTESDVLHLLETRRPAERAS